MTIPLRSLFVLVLFLTAGPAFSQTDKSGSTLSSGDMQAINIVGNADLSGELRVIDESIRVSGRMSIHLGGTDKDLVSGLVRIGGWNIAMFTVPQGAISGRDAKNTDEGFLGFAATTGNASLSFDPESQTLKGKIPGFVDTKYLSSVVLEDEGDVFLTATQPATLEVELIMDRPLAAPDQGVEVTKATINSTLTVKAMEIAGHKLPAYRIAFIDKPMKFQIAIWPFFEVGRQLCIQPVRIAKLTFRLGPQGLPGILFSTTGEGFAIGQPGAKIQWDKADVAFSYRAWKTLFESSYWTVSRNVNDQKNLRDMVDDADCVEVYFIDDFDPQDAYGGGMTWSAGLGEAKVIVGDGKARSGKGDRLLAHELGHVLGLHHPDGTAAATLTPASTGTVMCKSGFFKDNPQKNSQHNKDHVQNPLLTFNLKWRSIGPDCQHSNDCGPCPTP